MVDCDICGKPATGKAFVEGALLSVCGKCGLLGRRVNAPVQVRTAPAIKLVEIRFVDDAGKRLRTAREGLGMTPYQLAKRLMIQERIIRQMESGTHSCDEETAKKLEKELGISLLLSEEAGNAIEEKKAAVQSERPSRSDGLTLADFVKVKKK